MAITATIAIVAFIPVVGRFWLGGVSETPTMRGGSNPLPTERDLRPPHRLAFGNTVWGSPVTNPDSTRRLGAPSIPTVGPE
jgi:hypothetical protein